MKIVWLAPEAPVPPFSGGRERARRMLAYLAGRHQVTLVTFGAAGERAALRAIKGVAGVVAIPYPSGRLHRVNGWRMRLTAMAMVRRLRPDALHVGGPDTIPYIPAGFPGRLIYDYHDAPIRCEANLTLTPPDAVIAVSALDRNRLQRYWPSTPIFVVENGVDIDAWGKVQGTAERGLVLFPAALNWRPNQVAAQTLIDSILPAVRRHHPNARLVIAGRLPPSWLRALAAARPGVTLVADPPDMRPWFRRANVIAVPVEDVTGTRLRILQALAAGRPVVTTPDGVAGLPLVADRHLLVYPLLQPFARATAALLGDAERRSILVRAGQVAVRHLDWRKTLPGLDEVYV